MTPIKILLAMGEIVYKKQQSNNFFSILFALIGVLLFTGCKSGDDNDRTWSVYKADANSSSYSPLDEINTSNVSQLQPAWTFTLNDMPASAQPASSQCNPIIVDGVLYAMSAKQWAYAVNAA